MVLICIVANIVSLFKVMLILCRGETFRKESHIIGVARNLVPDHVHMMALTATAIKKAVNKFCQSLGMVHCYVIPESSDRLIWFCGRS